MGGGIEKTIESHKETLLPKVAHILKAFYDEDILDEEVIFEWGKKPSKKYVSKEFSAQIHKKAEAFLTWLKEAEEESEDEDEDSEVELEFDDRAKISTIKKRLSPIRMGKVRKALRLRSFLPKRMKTQMRRQKTIWTLMISKKIQFDFFSFTSTSSSTYIMQK